MTAIICQFARLLADGPSKFEGQVGDSSAT